MEHPLKTITIKTNIKELEVLFDELKVAIEKIKNFELKAIKVIEVAKED